MGELLGRAATLRQAELAHAQEVRQQDAARAAELSAKRALSQRRAAEFISIMFRNGVPKIPMYQRLIEPGKQNPLYKERDITVGYDHKGEGWIVRPRYYAYEEGIVPGIFLREDGTVSECDELSSTPPSEASLQVAADMRSRTYVLANQTRTTEDVYIGFPDPAVSEGIVFASEDGLSMLAEALVRYNISA